MSRTARRFDSIARSLLAGLAMTAGVTLASGALTGCADENDPETHVKRLSDPAQRAASVNRLIQFFEDAMTKDGKNRDGEHVKPLLEKIVQPMTEACLAGDLDERTNKAVIKFLSDARDPKGAPCLEKALKDYKPDVTEDDVRAAARAVRAMKLKSAAGPLLDAFKKIRHSKAKASNMDLDVAEAMFSLEDPSWEGDLINMLGNPVDPKDQNQMADQMYWQATAARVLGVLKSGNAVKPLLKVLLAPYKVAAQQNALLALVKIGKPAVGPSVALLKSDDKDLVEYSKGEQLKAAGADKNAAKGAEVAHIGVAAQVLATIGREDTAAPLVDAIGNPKIDDVSRAVIAAQLYQVPKNATTVKAFQDAFDKTSTSLSIPGASAGGREVLLESAGYFYDPSFVPWILKGAKDMKGEASDLAPIREAALTTIMKIMTADQVKIAQELVDTKTTDNDNKPSTVGKGFDKEWKITTDTLTACGSKSACWFDKLVDPNNQTEDKQFAAIKAAYMIAEAGEGDSRKKLVDAIPKLSNGAVRLSVARAIDYLSPKGDPATATELQKMVDDANEKKDETKMKAYGMLNQLIYRLNARAQN